MPSPAPERPPPTPLEQVLAAEIAADGPRGMDWLMAAALYHPQHGYYTTRSPLGASGDFITAPEISQMFGELVGLWLVQRWIDMGRPAPVHLVEAGPGRGTLMADILRATARVPGFADAALVHLVEINPALRAAQARALAAHAGRRDGLPDGRLAWHDALDSVPAGPTLLVANEFLDCLPVRQWVRTPDGWREKLVGTGPDGRLQAGLGPPDDAAGLPPADPPGTVREVMPGLAALIGRVASRLAAAPGVALLVDYGSSDASPGDTLQALWRHTKVGPLDHLGAADLTAHVDFTRVADLAAAAGLDVAGPVTQGSFLSALGLAARASTLIRANPSCAAAVRAAVERLADPCHMGGLFKVIALASRGLPHPPGL